MSMDRSEPTHLDEPDLPAVGQSVIVQCEQYRCLGYRSDDGKWRSAYSNQELEKVVNFYSL